MRYILAVLGVATLVGCDTGESRFFKPELSDAVYAAPGDPTADDAANVNKASYKMDWPCMYTVPYGSTGPLLQGFCRGDDPEYPEFIDNDLYLAAPRFSMIPAP